MVLVYTSLDKPDYNDEDYQCPVYIPSYSQHVPSLSHLNQTIHHHNACDGMGGCEAVFTVPINTIEDIQDCAMHRIALYSAPPWLLPF